jgi:hypothetical protein
VCVTRGGGGGDEAWTPVPMAMYSYPIMPPPKKVIVRVFPCLCMGYFEERNKGRTALQHEPLAN